MRKDDDDDFAMPENLSSDGLKAYEIITTFLKARDMAETGGCKVFYSPKEWKERGEEYGTESALVVVYDGGGHRRAFSMDACYEAGCLVNDFRAAAGSDLMPMANAYEPYEALQEELGKVGLFFEECTGWYCAVYKT